MAYISHTSSNRTYSRYTTDMSTGTTQTGPPFFRFALARHVAAFLCFGTLPRHQRIQMLHVNACTRISDGMYMQMMQFIPARLTLVPEQPQHFLRLYSWCRPPANALLLVPRTCGSFASRRSSCCRSAAREFPPHLHPPATAYAFRRQVHRVQEALLVRMTVLTIMLTAVHMTICACTKTGKNLEKFVLRTGAYA
jgi:hypothetical protein